MSSSFDESMPYKKRIISASLTATQREEFDRMKVAAKITTDGGLIKLALADLSHKLGTDRDPGLIERRLDEIKDEGERP